MPPQIPPSQISHFLSSQTIPVADPDDPICPICAIPYAPAPSSYVHPLLPDDIPEYAVEIHGRGSCAHIFGRRCVEMHIRGGNPWSHSCPICRAEWFPAPHAGRSEVLTQVERALNGLARLERHGVEEEVQDVERALERVREVLYGRRWI